MQTRREKPGPGQESVWDYPRPPRLENCTRRVRVIVGGVTIADSTRSRRVLETSHPPVYYIPPEDVDVECFVDSPDRSWCEWKGEARYYSVVVPGKAIDKAAWYYPNQGPDLPKSKATWRFTRAKWMPATLTRKECKHRKGISTVAGSPPTSWDRLKARPALWVGERVVA